MEAIDGSGLRETSAARAEYSCILFALSWRYVLSHVSCLFSGSQDRF